MLQFEYLPLILRGAAVTVELTVLTVIVAVILSFIAGLARLSSLRLVRFLVGVYVEVFRGTSSLVQIFFIFYVLPLYGLALEPVESAVLALGLNFGAYGSEIVRASVLSVNAGQHEAATALNMTRWLTMRRIILPQAVAAMLPPFGNLVIEIMKATSLVSVIGLTELTFTGKQLSEITARPGDVFSIVLVLYFVMALPFTRALRAVESRITRRLLVGRAG
jgi:polar amino acid transport system permease protein